MIHNSHRIYKRYQSDVEAAITGLGLGLLVGIVLANIPVYPPKWAPVLVAVIALVGFRWPMVAYLLAVLTLLYPIYTVSLYLAVLFLALTVLTHRPAGHYLGATVLLLSTPLLAKYHLHWTVPVLAGLWWGSVNGFWIAAFGALWGKVLGGMAGLEIDWLLMGGHAPSMAGIMQRFNGIGSLETLNKLIQPLAPDATLLLYHLLQVAVWALVAGLVGFLANHRWPYRNMPWTPLFISALGLIALGLGHLSLAVWLRQIDPVNFNYDPLLMATVVGLVVSSTLAIFRQALELPVAPRRRLRRATAPSATRTYQNQPGETFAQSPPSRDRPAPISLPELPEWEPPEDEDNDLILLELD